MCTTTPVTSSSVSGPGWPSTRTYWKPCVVCRGSNGVPEPSDTTTVDSARAEGLCVAKSIGSEVVLRDVTGRVERFAVGERELGAARAGIGDAHPAVDVLAEIDHVATGRNSRTVRGRTVSTRRTGGAGDAQSDVKSPSTTSTGCHSSASSCDALVDVFAVDEVGGDDRARGAGPGRVGCRDDGAVDLHLRRARELRAVDVVFTREADLASVPAVGQHDAQLVVALHEEGRAMSKVCTCTCDR